MPERILITGGAGFIGSHLADELLEHGYEVRVLDNLTPQVHPHLEKDPPDYLHKDVEFIYGDIRDQGALAGAVEGVDGVFHLAAAVGVGQSMYRVEEYTSVNTYGTSVLLQELLSKPVKKLVVASSMSIYGEGLYRTSRGTFHTDAKRSLERIREGRWELLDEDGTPLRPIPTTETKTPTLASIYALSKYDQEQMCLMIGRAYQIPTTALRFFNVYGTRQALSNPYTGVLAIFASRYLNDNPPLIFEDGMQRRDFVSVRDVAVACRLALEKENTADRTINIGSGSSHTVVEAAREMGRVLGREKIIPRITGKYRVGDIRHCFADTSLAQSVLGYSPEVTFRDGLRELSAWLAEQTATDRVEQAAGELQSRGLTV